MQAAKQIGINMSGIPHDMAESDNNPPNNKPPNNDLTTKLLELIIFIT